jgi:hypothetical protein
MSTVDFGRGIAGILWGHATCKNEPAAAEISSNAESKKKTSPYDEVMIGLICSYKVRPACQAGKYRNGAILVASAIR